MNAKRFFFQRNSDHFRFVKNSNLAIIHSSKSSILCYSRRSTTMINFFAYARFNFTCLVFPHDGKGNPFAIGHESPFPKFIIKRLNKCQKKPQGKYNSKKLRHCKPHTALLLLQQKTTSNFNNIHRA